MKVDYDHSQNRHTVEGPRAAFGKLFSQGLPDSLLDVGCGTGTWLRAALDAGVRDVFGVDGAEIPSERLLFPPEQFRRVDLTAPVDLGRRFSVAICLEVSEHLEEKHGTTLLDTLVRHSDCIVFSAACPEQPGQHHVNCQWPIWWQERFNSRGYYCTDEMRWLLWDERRLEPWYRQNIFMARNDRAAAGREPRLKAVIHPEMLDYLTAGVSPKTLSEQIEHGSMPVRWYLATPIKALIAKMGRAMRGSRQP